MTERSVVALVEDWQTGSFVVLACGVVGVAVGMTAGTVVGPRAFLPGFVLGGFLAFFGYAYVRYGR